MSNPQRKPASDLRLKLHWLSERDTLGVARQVVMELHDLSGLVVATMMVSSDQLLQALARQLDHHPLVTLDGSISITFDGSSSSQSENPPIALDQLVADVVLPEMLEDEPEAARMLAEFRSRLLKSVEHVDNAIASLPKL